MDAIRLGRSCRALRVRRRWRQEDLAAVAGVSRWAVSLVERGQLKSVSVGNLTRIASSLEADVDIRLRWHGEGMDRLLDQVHAELVEGAAGMLRRDVWETAIEVSFSKRGERGSIDVFGRHRATGVVLVVEVKSVVPDSQALLHALDRKTRLAPEIARDRGWACSGVARLLIVGESSTSRRRISALGETYSVAFPTLGWAVRRWLRAPTDGMSGLLFLPYARGSGTSARSTGVQRVRKRGIFPGPSHTPATDAVAKNSGLGSS